MQAPVLLVGLRTTMAYLLSAISVLLILFAARATAQASHIRSNLFSCCFWGNRCQNFEVGPWRWATVKRCVLHLPQVSAGVEVLGVSFGGTSGYLQVLRRVALCNVAAG